MYVAALAHVLKGAGCVSNIPAFYGQSARRGSELPSLVIQSPVSCSFKANLRESNWLREVESLD